jgi:predicted secreted protein
MAKAEVSVTINRPLEDGFTVLTDVEKTDPVLFRGVPEGLLVILHRPPPRAAAVRFFARAATPVLRQRMATPA